MPKSYEKANNYSLVIYQSAKHRERVYLQLRKGGKIVDSLDYKKIGRSKGVGSRARQIVEYARSNKVDFKTAWNQTRNTMVSPLA